ncbi:MAG: hypothetical protein Q9207_007963, partial [Kuettlingeria erythrocarpa]
AAPKGPIWTDFTLTNRAHNALLDTRGALEDAFPGVPLVRVRLCWRFWPEEEEEEDDDEGDGDGEER